MPTAAGRRLRMPINRPTTPPTGSTLIQAITTQQDVWAHPGQNFTDVSVEVDATKASGPDNNGFGVVCRFQDNDNFYYFMVSSDGFQVIGKYEGGENKYLTAEKMQPTRAVNAGTPPTTSAATATARR